MHQRGDAVSSLVYEANARMRDPVYGCVGAISYLQNQVSELQMQLAVAQAEILCIQMQQQETEVGHVLTLPHHHHHQDDKSFVLAAAAAATNNFNNNHYLNFASSINNSNNGSTNVMTMQDPLKRESLWT